MAQSLPPWERKPPVRRGRPAAVPPQGLLRKPPVAKPPERAAQKPAPAPERAPETPPSPRASAAPAKRFPGYFYSRRYEAVELIGEGGWGPVYKARDKVLGMVVAVKFLPEHMLLSKEAVRAFKQEARMAMALSHENIVRLHNLEVERGRVFLVMEYVEGETLRQVVQRVGRLTLDSVLSIAKPCCAALEYAHKMGVLHRDLKPDNLMVNRESELRIIDFGTARAIHIHLGTVQEDFVEGTPGYMSPEMIRGAPVDVRTDVFSLGATLAELLTGTRLFPAVVDPRRLGELQAAPLAGVPEAVSAVILQSVALDPAQRLPSARALWEALALAAHRPAAGA